MGASQRRKGASYELEVAKQLSKLLALSGIVRKLDQTRDGGEDLEGTGNLVIECKRRKSMTTLYNWMRQCITACGLGYVTGEKIPVVILRGDNEESLLVIRLADINRLSAEVLTGSS